MSAEEKTYAEALGAGDPSGSSGESERISTTGDQSGRSSERLEAPSVAGPRSSGDQQDGSGSLDLMRPRAAAAASYLQGDQFGHSPDDDDVYSADGSFAGNTIPARRIVVPAIAEQLVRSKQKLRVGHNKLRARALATQIPWCGTENPILGAHVDGRKVLHNSRLTMTEHRKLTHIIGMRLVHVGR